MTNPRWERIAAAGGIAFVVLFVAGDLVVRGLSGSLAHNAPAEEVARYFVENEGTLHVGTHIIGLGLFFFFGFLGSLWSVLRRAEGGNGWLSTLAFGSGMATGTLLLAQQAAWRAGFHGMHVSDLGPQGASALFALFNNFDFGPVFSLAVLLTTTAIVTIRTQALPRWLGWASAVLALLFLIAGGQTTYLALPLFALWVIATSVVLIRRAPSKARGVS